MVEHSTFGVERLTRNESSLRLRDAVGLVLLPGGISILGFAIFQALGFASPTGCGSPFRTQNIGSLGDPWVNGACLLSSAQHREVAFSLAGIALGLLVGSILLASRMPRRTVAEIFMSTSRAESVREIVLWVGVLGVVLDVLLLTVGGFFTVFNASG
jgi:hypothetical protein